MEAGFVITISIVILSIGILIGMMIRSSSPTKVYTQGIIYAYYGEFEDNPSLLLEHSVPIDEIASKKRVMFDVVVVKRNSQK